VLHRPSEPAVVTGYLNWCDATSLVGALLYQLLLPYREGHLSTVANLEDDPLEIAKKVVTAMGLSGLPVRSMSFAASPWCVWLKPARCYAEDLVESLRERHNVCRIPIVVEQV
jgi:hypothetical protein